MDDAANVFPGAFEGYVCAVDGDYWEEVFADGLVYDCFDLFFGFCWGLCVYPVADALFEGFSGRAEGCFGNGGEEVCPRGKPGALYAQVEFLCGVLSHSEVTDDVFLFLSHAAVSDSG